MLPDGDILPLGVVLRTVAHLPEGLGHAEVDVVAADLDAAAGRRLFRCDDPHGGSFSGSVMAQQTEHLASLDGQREVSHGDLLRRGRLLDLAPQAAVARRRLLLVILFAEVLWEGGRKEELDMDSE